jgi:hypothetical protein
MSWQGTAKEALNNASVDYQGKTRSKWDFDLVFIFNNLPVMKMAACACAAEPPGFSEVP